jgi:hypothetical protein
MAKPRRVALSLACLFIALGRPAQMSACECKELSLEDALRRADVVFTGRVVGLGLDYERGERIATMKVDRVFKGDVSGRLRVVTALTEAACGYMFAREKTYVIFARAKAGRVATSLCEGNLVISPGKWPAALGSGESPTTPSK